MYPIDMYNILYLHALLILLLYLSRYLTGTLVYENKLCTLGGTGLNMVPKGGTKQDKGAEYHQTYFKGVGYGLNNEYYEFDMITRKTCPFTNFVIKYFS